MTKTIKWLVCYFLVILEIFYDFFLQHKIMFVITLLYFGVSEFIKSGHLNQFPMRYKVDTFFYNTKLIVLFKGSESHPVFYPSVFQFYT
jgi:hypothetical protein